MNDKEKLEKQIKELEENMLTIGFWDDKQEAQEVIKKLNELKAEKEGVGKYDKGSAIITVISGAGGDDSEDFTRMLFEMYMKYAGKNGWQVSMVHKHENDHEGYKNISIEVSGKGAYGKLKGENGVHRLVRISPFNSNSKRHTSFALVEVLPKFGKLEEKDIVIPEQDLKVEFSKSGGPGGQNVNKRETAVRIVHTPTGLSTYASGQRTQEANRDQAMSMLRAKIVQKAEEHKKSVEESMSMNYGGEIEWGNQIRSYVLHPYKMVKDHEYGVETQKVEDVLDGDLDLIIGEK